MNTVKKPKTSLRKKADSIKHLRCKNLIAVLENPKNYRNLATTVRNINALGVEKTYVIDKRGTFAAKWEEMRTNKKLMEMSASAIKWSFVKIFESTEACVKHLKKNNVVSVVTSPHIKGKNNVVLHEGTYTQTKLAVWFGSESHGISDEAVEHAEACIQIPMCGIIESLNLGTSTGIVMYEVTKQRRTFQEKYTSRTDIRKNAGKKLHG